jgi:hypothetical protein
MKQRHGRLIRRCNISTCAANFTIGRMLLGRRVLSLMMRLMSTADIEVIIGGSRGGIVVIVVTVHFGRGLGKSIYEEIQMGS